MLFYLFISFLICGNFDFTFAQCNKCGAGNIACLDKNSFHMCLENEPMPSMGNFKCEDDTVCVSANPARCLAAGSPASCGANCGTCNALTSAMCTDAKNFTLCANNQPTNNLGNCPDKYVCNSGIAGLCVLETAPEGPTCPIPPTTEPPTVEPPGESTDPTEFCLAQKNVRFPRKFPAPGNCERYFYCAIIHSKTEGYAFACPNTMKFNCITQSCGPTCVPC